MSDADLTIDQLVDQYSHQQISRRDFFRRAALIGVTATGAASLLATVGSRTAQANPTQASAPVKGGTLREGYNRDVAPIDPVGTTWWDAGLFPVTHETLLTADAKGKFVPLLAQNWTTSKDGRTWKFQLRPGLKFQSGAPCDAKAVAAALAIIAKQGVNAGFWSPMKSVKATGKTTVTITLAHPYADLPYVINTGYSAIFNPAVRKKLKSGYGSKGVDGTGPFSLVELVPGSHSSFKRWEGYPGAGSAKFFKNKGPAYLDGIQFVVLPEPASRAQELLSNNIDALLGPAPQDFANLKANSDIATFELQEWGMYQLGLDFANAKAGFDKAPVRQAISMAIDRDAICKTIFFGKAVPVYTLVPPAFPWYVKATEKAHPYDPEKAKSMLATAGHPKITFTTIVEADKTEQVLAQSVQAMLAKVGVDMKLEVHGADWFTVVPKSNAYITHDIWPYLFDASLLWTGSSYVPPACCNFTHIKVPALDKAYAAWQSAKDSAALAAASRTAQTVFADQLPFIPLVTPMNLWAHHKRVHNWLPTQPNLYPFYQDVYIDKKS
ncbi:MAG: peptide/nickel transport system substrate-binding protein [Gaiellales bacterium]|nr:peptide/nickel transport system substrate-binding protein [Gaiellales bacterium]